jgi:hypothetical protein
MLDNITATAGLSRNNTRLQTYSTYSCGYYDALNGEINLAAYDQSDAYYQGYEDALHDTAMTTPADDLVTF